MSWQRPVAERLKLGENYNSVGGQVWRAILERESFFVCSEGCLVATRWLMDGHGRYVTANSRQWLDNSRDAAVTGFSMEQNV